LGQAFSFSKIAALGTQVGDCITIDRIHSAGQIIGYQWIRNGINIG